MKEPAGTLRLTAQKLSDYLVDCWPGDHMGSWHRAWKGPGNGVEGSIHGHQRIESDAGYTRGSWETSKSSLIFRETPIAEMKA